MPAFTTAIQYYTGSSSQSKTQKQKDSQISKEEVSYPYSNGYDLTYIENPKEYTPTKKTPNMLIKKIQPKNRENNLKSNWDLKERVTHHIQRNTGKKNRFFGNAEGEEQSLKKTERKNLTT